MQISTRFKFNECDIKPMARFAFVRVKFPMWFGDYFVQCDDTMKHQKWDEHLV